MMKRALGIQAPMVPSQAPRGFATFDQAIKGRLAALANVKPPYPDMMEDSKEFRKRMGGPKVTDALQPYSGATDRCELRVHFCPPPWFYNIHGVWIVGDVDGIWVVHWIPSGKQQRSNKTLAAQQLLTVDSSTEMLMNEYWKSIHGVHHNPSLWIHENAKHSFHNLRRQMPDYFHQVAAMGSQVIALLWKLGIKPNCFYKRDHFLGILKKSQGVDVYLDLIKDVPTGIVYLEAFGFFYVRAVLPGADWIKVDHPSAWVQRNAYFFVTY